MKFKIQNSPAKLIESQTGSRKRLRGIWRGKFKRFFFTFLILFLSIGLIGCDAFVRKFTRKKKRDTIEPGEIVITPEEWTGPKMTKEQLYHQYFFFWKSWQDELIESLRQNKSHKKRVDCITEAIKNLVNIRAMLNPETQKRLDVYLVQFSQLQDRIKQDTYGNSNDVNRLTAERLKLDMQKNFSYTHVKNDLI